MVIAALVCFVALLIAWVVAPDDGAAAERARHEVGPEAEALPA